MDLTINDYDVIKRYLFNNYNLGPLNSGYKVVINKDALLDVECQYFAISKMSRSLNIPYLRKLRSKFVKRLGHKFCYYFDKHIDDNPLSDIPCVFEVFKLMKI